MKWHPNVRLRPPLPQPLHGEVREAASALLHARHLFAYRWAAPYATGKRVLEIGTNRGYGLQALRPLARELVGVDLSFDMADQAAAASGVPVLRANGQALPFANGTFDVVVAFQVIEHVWDDLAFLKEIRRILRPGGHLLLTSPQRKTRLLPGQFPWNEEHLREYDESQWRAVLGAVFDHAEVAGVRGDPLATSLEAARVFQDPWGHFLRHAALRPVRFIGRMGHRYWTSPASLPDEAALAEVATAEPDALVARFGLAEEELEGALDLTAVCRRSPKSASDDDPSFAPAAYWSARHLARPGLTATGTLGPPLAWQRWMYRGKERAYSALLARNRVNVAGRRVLDFGCGTGHFETVWEGLGASQTAGVDVVGSCVRPLQAAHPERAYAVADPSEGEPLPADFGLFDLITAIDVMYHIVDDACLETALRTLVAHLAPGGQLLITDRLVDSRPAPHVRFRSKNHWHQILDRLDLVIGDIEPVFVVQNRPGVWARTLPRATGMLEYLLDYPARVVAPWAANNWAFLARRPR